jgi:hypothetical protein
MNIKALAIVAPLTYMVVAIEPNNRANAAQDTAYKSPDKP